MALYAADGSIRVTEVTGLAITGAYAADGSWNVVPSLGTTFVGTRHPCGALWVTVITSSSQRGIYAPDGSLYIQVTPYSYPSAGIRVTDVLGTLSYALIAPVATWVSDAATAQAVFQLIVDDGVVSGDKIWGESSLDNFATVLETVSASISAPDLGDLQIDSFAFSPFADGLTYARFWITNSSDVRLSENSNIISLTIAASTTAGEAIGLLLLLTKAA